MHFESPVLTHVARPLELTVAIASSSLDHVKVALGLAASATSSATAVNCWVAPSITVAVSGVKTTFATTAGGRSSSLQVPKLCALGPLHVPAPSLLSEWPAGVAAPSLTGMFVDVIPFAGPFRAVIGPP